MNLIVRLLRRYRARKQAIVIVPAILIRRYEQTVASRAAAIASLSDCLAEIQLGLNMERDPDANDGLVFAAYHTLAKLEVDLEWVECLKFAGMSIGLIAAGGDPLAAEDCVAELERSVKAAQIASCEAAAQIGIVREAHQDAIRLSQYLEDIPRDALARLVMCTPTLAKVLFEEKRSTSRTVEVSEEMMAESLRVRRSLVRNLVEEPQAPKLNGKTRKKVDLALESTARRDVRHLDERHREVSAALKALTHVELGDRYLRCTDPK